MKKILSIIVMFIVCFCLASCGHVNTVHTYYIYLTNGKVITVKSEFYGVSDVDSSYITFFDYYDYSRHPVSEIKKSEVKYILGKEEE